MQLAGNGSLHLSQSCKRIWAFMIAGRAPSSRYQFYSSYGEYMIYRCKISAYFSLYRCTFLPAQNMMSFQKTLFMRMLPVSLSTRLLLKIVLCWDSYGMMSLATNISYILPRSMVIMKLEYLFLLNRLLL